MFIVECRAFRNGLPKRFCKDISVSVNDLKTKSRYTTTNILPLYTNRQQKPKQKANRNAIE